MTTLINRRTVRIEWGDCDAMGIVYFPRYLAIFDDCTAYLFEQALGLNKYQLLRAYDFAGFPMVDIRAQFMTPSRFGDDVEIESRISEFRRSSFDVHHRLFKGDQMAVEGFETRVWVRRHPEDQSRIKAQPIPREVIERFSRG